MQLGIFIFNFISVFREINYQFIYIKKKCKQKHTKQCNIAWNQLPTYLAIVSARPPRNKRRPQENSPFSCVYRYRVHSLGCRKLVYCFDCSVVQESTHNSLANRFLASVIWLSYTSSLLVVMSVFWESMHNPLACCPHQLDMVVILQFFTRCRWPRNDLGCGGEPHGVARPDAFYSEDNSDVSKLESPSSGQHTPSFFSAKAFIQTIVRTFKFEHSKMFEIVQPRTSVTIGIPIRVGAANCLRQGRWSSARPRFTKGI